MQQAGFAPPKTGYFLSGAWEAVVSRNSLRTLGFTECASVRDSLAESASSLRLNDSGTSVEDVSNGHA